MVEDIQAASRHIAHGVAQAVRFALGEISRAASAIISGRAKMAMTAVTGSIRPTETAARKYNATRRYWDRADRGDDQAEQADDQALQQAVAA